MKNRKNEKEQDGSQQVEFLYMSGRTINVRLCRSIPSSPVINNRQLSELELHSPVRSIQNQIYDNRTWLMLTDRAAISRSLFLIFFFYVSSCSLTCQVKANSIQSNQSKSEPFLPLCIYDKWMIIINMNIFIFTITKKSKV